MPINDAKGFAKEIIIMIVSIICNKSIIRRQYQQHQEVLYIIM
jgi:hypothetical protein